MALNTLNGGLSVANTNVTPILNEIKNEPYDFNFINENNNNNNWKKGLPNDLINTLEKLDDMERAVLQATNGDYKVEKHHAYTVDGYQLNLYHVVESGKNGVPLKKKNPKKEVFCLGHGLFESSISTIANGYTSLPIKLFLKNYDVWLCNNRGSGLTEYVGKKYAMKKNLERYTIEDLYDIGFDENDFQKKNNQDQPNLTKNKSDVNTKEVSKTNLRQKPTTNCQNNGNGKEPMIGETSKSGTLKQKKLTSNTKENVRNDNLFNSDDINIKKMFELVGITEKDLKSIDNMKRKDVKKNIKEKNRWTFEDMGAKDIPAIVKYIATETQQDKIKYVGLSQGSISFLIGGCVSPYVNNSIEKCYLMSLPIILPTRSNMERPLKMFIAISKHFKTILKFRRYLMKYLPKKYHKHHIIDLAHHLTSDVLKFVLYSPSNKDIYYLNTPSGSTSDANMKRWLSSFIANEPTTGIFEKNNKRCTIPICLIYGDKDCLVDSDSSIKYMQKIFKPPQLEIIRHPEWSHLDPMVSDNDDIIFSHIIKDSQNDKPKKKKN
ncbi:steryl ester hydrolase, putative [Plasmodium vinckei vinckei]|uniref:Steryl ester hydrolase, putative n=1 Tax=Plasmodium vinckei vinckei TaxID=54757 RepID=A0A449BSI0_PLAVN|nr:steryl ester hydrolase, putative [Plasmodium vinckei vinckei]KEG02195.1 hypothetical protein YYE_02934 [Plasmodium vinckei vinckei]VEV56436.1 steryl ester hydrolase, putative [Plasmodium vinckei vinckei]